MSQIVGCGAIFSFQIQITTINECMGLRISETTGLAEQIRVLCLEGLNPVLGAGYVDSRLLILDMIGSSLAGDRTAEPSKQAVATARGASVFFCLKFYSICFYVLQEEAYLLSLTNEAQAIYLLEIPLNIFVFLPILGQLGFQLLHSMSLVRSALQFLYQSVFIVYDLSKPINLLAQPINLVRSVLASVRLLDGDRLVGNHLVSAIRHGQLLPPLSLGLLLLKHLLYSCMLLIFSSQPILQLLDLSIEHVLLGFVRTSAQALSLADVLPYLLSQGLVLLVHFLADGIHFFQLFPILSDLPLQQHTLLAQLFDLHFVILTISHLFLIVSYSIPCTLQLSLQSLYFDGLEHDCEIGVAGTCLFASQGSPERKPTLAKGLLVQGLAAPQNTRFLGCNGGPWERPVFVHLQRVLQHPESRDLVSEVG